MEDPVKPVPFHDMISACIVLLPIMHDMRSHRVTLLMTIVPTTRCRVPCAGEHLFQAL